MINIVFMGTPPFAVETLKQIIGAGFCVSAVVTSVDKPAGRGLQLQPSAVKAFALENNIPLLQPMELSSESFVLQLQAINPDIIVVVAFKKLPKAVWMSSKYGTFNVHASLLPQYRGAAPIQHAIMNGEKKTGITTFLLDDNIDTGKIILQKEIPIEDSDTFLDVHNKLMYLGAECAVETINLIVEGKYSPVEQSIVLSDAVLKIAPKIHKENCEIKWNTDVVSIYNKIRALSPTPCAYAYITNSQKEKILVKIFQSYYKVDHSDTTEVGSIISDNRTFLGIKALGGTIFITDIQVAGKKRMNIKDYLRGVRL